MIGTRFHGILLVFLALLPGAAARPAGAGEPTPRAWSVQLHVHSSYSEGVGSIDSHSHEATDVGADAIWWSDHDFRVTSYHHASSFGFEDWTEPIDRGESWRDFDWLPRGRADDREEDAGPPRKGLRRKPLRSLAGGGGAIVADRADEVARLGRCSGGLLGRRVRRRERRPVRRRRLGRRRPLPPARAVSAPWLFSPARTSAHP